MALKAVHVSGVPNLYQEPEDAAPALSCCSSSSTFSTGEDSVMAPFKPQKFMVIGHRGSGMNMLNSTDVRLNAIKENSILSFNEAGKSGVDFVEFDVQVTRDDCAIIFHDNFILAEEEGCILEKRVTELSSEEFLRYGPQRRESPSLPPSHPPKKKKKMAPPQSLLSTTSFLPFFSPLPKLPNPHFFPLRNPKPRKPALIFFCCSSNAADSQTQQQRPASEGAGPAAPTRGDLFLQRHQSMEAVKNKTTTSMVKKKKKKIKLSSSVASCYGCGAPLQTTELDAPGYVHLDTYELKKKHRQLRTILCGRCKLLSHGHMITAVGGNGGYSGGKQFVSAEELREKLSHLRYEKALIVKLVDIVDFNGSFLARIRDLTGSNPIILVITKVDLLPKGTDLNCVGDWVVEATTKKKLNVLSVHLTSSKSLVGIAGVASEIQKEKKGRDVYILGSANVGKSAFINALLKMMANKDPVAAAAQRYKPMQSAVPGTTLGPIQIDAFHGGAKLFDTPGVHLHHRQAAVIHSEDLPLLAPQNRLRGQSFPVTSDKKMLSEAESPGLNGISIFWGGLVRVDILKVLPQTRLTFYGPRAVPIHTVPTVEADEFYKKELGVSLTPPTGEKRAEGWSGLQTVRQLQIKFEDQKRPACDIAISGLGWIGIEHATKQLEISDSKDSEEASGELHLAVHVPKPVEVFMRPAMPVGNAGREWYEYRELTDKEEELRPKWYF